MEIDYSPIFKRYEQVVAEADAVFSHVKKAFPQEVKCKTGCADCCYALFDLSFMEALYLNHKFNTTLAPETRDTILGRADRADRKAHQVKREAFQAAKKGKQAEDVFHRVAWERVRCPLLNDDDQCQLYEFRPITCRVYGIPTQIQDKSHTCGLSGFEEGKPYPALKMDKLQDKLHDLSQDLVRALPTKFVKMSEVLVPVSMALMTVYNDEYLGIPEIKKDKGQEAQEPEKKDE